MKLSLLVPALSIVFALPQGQSDTSALEPSQFKQVPVNFCFICGGGCGGGCGCGDSACPSTDGGSQCTTGSCNGNGPVIIGGGGSNAYRVALRPLEEFLRQQQMLRNQLAKGLNNHN